MANNATADMFREPDPFSSFRKASNRGKGGSEILDISMVNMSLIIVKNDTDLESSGCFGKRVITSQKSRYVEAYRALKSCVPDKDLQFFNSSNYPQGKGIKVAERQTLFEQKLQSAALKALKVSCELRHPIANKVKQHEWDKKHKGAKNKPFRSKEGVCFNLSDFARLVEDSKKSLPGENSLPATHAPKVTDVDQSKLGNYFSVTKKRKSRPA